jgi:hypothetical protein
MAAEAKGEPGLLRRWLQSSERVGGELVQSISVWIRLTGRTRTSTDPSAAGVVSRSGTQVSIGSPGDDLDPSRRAGPQYTRGAHAHARTKPICGRLLNREVSL